MGSRAEGFSVLGVRVYGSGFGDPMLRVQELGMESQAEDNCSHVGCGAS